MVSPVLEESSTVDEATDAPVTLGNGKSTTTDEQLVNPRPQTEHTATPGLMEGKEHSATPGPSGSPSPSPMPSVPAVQGPNSSDEARDVNLRNMKSILSHTVGSSPGSSQGFMHDLTKSREATLVLHKKLKDFAITLEDVQLKYAESQSRLQNAESLLLNSEEQIKFWKTFASARNSEMGDLDARCKGSDLVIKELEDKVKILVKENNKASADIKALKESSRKVSEERDVINGQCKEKDLEIKRLEDNVAELEKNVKALKDSAHEATVSREELRRQYDDKILEIKMLEENLKAFEQFSRKESEESQGLKRKIEEKDLVIEKLDEKVEKLVEEKTTLEESYHKESEDRNGRIEELDLVIKELNEKVKELVEEKTSLEESSHKESEDRNGRIEEQDLVIKELKEKVKELVKEKNGAYADVRNQQLVPRERQETWVAPADGIIKLNCSAFYFWNRGAPVTVVGAVARDHTGRVLRWQRFPIPGCLQPAFAEAIAVRESINLAAAMQWLRICIESDCKILVDTLQYFMQQEQVEISLVTTVVLEIVTLSRNFASIEFGLVSRNCNFLARGLVRGCTAPSPETGDNEAT